MSGRYSKETKLKALELRNQGHSYREIMGILGIESSGAIRNWLKKFNEGGIDEMLKDERGLGTTGRPRKKIEVMTKEKIQEKLITMKEQHILELHCGEVKKPEYINLYFLKINNDKFLACDSLAGFLYGTIVPENYMSLGKVSEMIYEHTEKGFVFKKISNPKFYKVIE